MKVPRTRSLFFSSIILVGFAGYFSFEILTLRKALHHPDIYTYYYPFRQWFVEQLKELRFPIWNPYWGLGHGVEVWSSIPLDLYTPLELLIGPYYHYYQLAQLIAILATTSYVLLRLGFNPLLSVAGAIVFFMSPLVAYWYFSFLITHVYIAHVLLFFFVWEWCRSGQKRYVFLIAVTTALSMLGTKIEFWFYQGLYFTFLAVLMPIMLDGPPYRISFKKTGLVLLGMGAGIAANIWQLNILARLIGDSGRLADYGLGNLFNGELYRNLFLSVVDSVLWQMLLLGVLIYLVAMAKARHRPLFLVALVGSAYLLWQIGAVNLGYGAVEDLPNPSFESWIETLQGALLPQHFTFTRNGVGCGVERITGTDKVRDGQAAVFLRPPSAGNCYLRAQVEPAERFRGRQVRLILWARSENTEKDAIQFDLQDGRGAPSIESLPISGRWQRIQVERHVDPGARFLLLTFNVTDRSTAGVAIDKLEVMVSRSVPARSRSDYVLSGVLGKFATGPVLPGMLVGMLLSLVVLRDFDWRSHLRTAVLFTPLIFYWCRSGPADLDETQIMALAPPAFITMISALAWLGCRLLGADRLTNLAYASILFVFLMRDQGQIILAYLTSLLWMPTRDNYIIDLAATLLAIGGLSSVAAAVRTRVRDERLARYLPGVLPLAAIAVTVVSASGNLYYSQVLMRPAPPNYPFYQGVPALRQTFHELRQSPTTRAYLANYDAWGFTYGFGEALLERVGQITMYASLTSQRYKDWTIFHQLGIRPDQRWDGYPGNYSAATIARLPRKKTLGHDNWTYYHYTVIARPPIRQGLLDLLGVNYVVKLHPITSREVVEHQEPGQIDREIAALHPKSIRPLAGIAHPGVQASMTIAEMAHPLPRAYLAYGVTPDAVPEFQRELSPRVLAGAIQTQSHRFPIAPATITRYEPERVTVEVEADREAVLVLGDLHHPFWTAMVDGEPAPIFPALHLFRGVTVPPGRHRIEFVCRVPYLAASAVLSLLVGMAGVTLFLRNRRCSDF